MTIRHSRVRAFAACIGFAGRLLRVAVTMAMALALAVATIVATTTPASAQQSDGSAKVQRLLDLAGSADNPPTESVRLPQREASGKPADDVSYDLRQRPASPPQLNLTTSVETHVENKTTNTVSGGGAARAGEGPPAPPQTRPRGIEAATEFRALVAQSLGYELPLFGDSLFRNGNAMGGADPLTVPADYRIGPGDQLLIHAWGQISIDFQGPVGRSGSVFLPGIGDVMVAGQRLSEARDMLRGIIGTQYRDFDITVSLAELRDIRIYLSGFVDAPGVHTVPSTATALYGLLASGGPGPGADLRRIEVLRGGQRVAVFDAYRFLIDGDKSGDPQLLPGDVIHLPAAKGFVAIAGSVRRPAIYHLDDTMTLQSLLSFAGGATVLADPLETRIERFEHGTRTVLRIEGDPRTSTQRLRDGDIVMLVPASPKFDGSITVSGHVSVPLRTPWRPGLTVSDVLPDADALAPHADAAGRNARAPLAGVSAARDGVALPPRPAEVDWDHAAIQRIAPGTQQVSVIDFDLGAALASPHAAGDPLLQAGDTIVIYGKDDFAQPERKRMRLVRIEGEVAVPGVYSMPVGATLQDLVARAGGATREAYLYGTVVGRESVRQEETRRLREAVDRIEEDYYRFLATRSRDTIDTQDAQVAGVESGATRTLIERLRAVKPIGRVVMALEREPLDVAELPGLSLEDGDVVRIPGRTDTVTVVGAVFQQGTLLWKRGDDARDYIARSGGYRPYADNSEAVVVHADGSVQPLGHGFGGVRVHPGDSIVVPEDVGHTTFGRKLRDWATMLYQMAIGAAALKVIGQ